MAKDPKIQDYLRHSAVGIEMGLSVVVGLLVGWFLDDYFGTEPWLLLVFLILGMVAGFRSMLRAARRMREQAQHDRESGP